MTKRWIAVGVVLGVLGTMGVLTALPSEVRYAEVVTQAQDRLADTMRRIDYFKAEHGAYPDTLEAFAIDRDARLVKEQRSIIEWRPEYLPSWLDPTQDVQNVLFYERTPDGRYHLRAVGPDGKSFTGDDIVPDVTRRLEGSTGLVEARVLAPEIVSALPQ